jgi:hypothetical protein
MVSPRIEDLVKRIAVLEEKVISQGKEIQAESAARVTRCRGIERKIDAIKKK